MPPSSKRFRVALSFPDNHRAYAERVAESLAGFLGRERVFYDRWYADECNRANLNAYLQGIYQHQSDLTVVFLTPEYETEEWCGLEWRVLRELFRHGKDDALLPVRFDTTFIPGLFSLDTYLGAQDKTPEQIAALIGQRLNTGPSIPPPPPPPRPWFKIAAAAAVLSMAAFSLWLGSYENPLHRQIRQARTFLNSGRYQEATREYQRILDAHADQQEVRLALEQAKLGEEFNMDEHFDPADFGPRVQALLRLMPNAPFLVMLDGDRYYQKGEVELAMSMYERAIALDRGLAEAYFRLGMLRIRQGKLDEAGALLEEASVLGPDSLAYRNGLVVLDLMRTRYDQVIEQYQGERFGQYPLAKLEQAKAYWGRGDLALAEKSQILAQMWLEDEAIAALPQNRFRWELSTLEGRAVNLRSKECKHYYASLALAATQYMYGQEAEEPVSGCADQAAGIRSVVAADLQRHAESHKLLAEKALAFRLRLLAGQ